MPPKKLIHLNPLEVWLACLIPLAWAGGLAPIPWFALPLWALTLLLSRFDSAQRTLSWPLHVFIALGLALTLQPDWLEVVKYFFGLLVVGAALQFSFTMVMHGLKVGLVPLLAMLLLFPHPLSFLALLAGFFALGETTQQAYTSKPLRSSGVMPLLLGLGVVLTLMTLVLPRAGLSLDTTLPKPPTETSRQLEPTPQEQQAAPARPPRRSSPLSSVVVQNPTEPLFPAWFKPLLEAIFAATTLTCVLILLSMLRYRERGTAVKMRLDQVLAVVAILAVSVMGLLWLTLSASGAIAGILGGMRDNGQTPDLPNPTDQPLVIQPSQNMLNTAKLLGYGLLISGLVTLLMLLGGLWTLWRFRPNTISPPKTSLTKPASPSLPPLPINPDTVRALYAQFLEQMSKRSFSRFEAETPLEYAARIAQEFPALERDVTLITAIYVPVRYGDLPDQARFEEARLALERLKEESERRTGPIDAALSKTVEERENEKKI